MEEAIWISGERKLGKDSSFSPVKEGDPLTESNQLIEQTPVRPENLPVILKKNIPINH